MYTQLDAISLETRNRGRIQVYESLRHRTERRCAFLNNPRHHGNVWKSRCYSCVPVTPKPIIIYWQKPNQLDLI